MPPQCANDEVCEGLPSGHVCQSLNRLIVMMHMGGQYGYGMNRPAPITTPMADRSISFLTQAPQGSENQRNARIAIITSPNTMR